MNPKNSRLLFLAGLLGASLCGEPMLAQQGAWPPGSPPPTPSARQAPPTVYDSAARVALAAYGKQSRGLEKLSLQFETSAPDSSPQLVISGGQHGSLAFLVAGTARTAGPRQLGGIQRVQPDLVVPFGAFDASGSAAMQVGDLARFSSGSAVWLQAMSADGTSSPPVLLAELVAAQFGIRAPAAGEWCWTHQQYLRSQQGGAPSLVDNCPELGPCDNPGTRDAAIPDGNTPIKTVRLSIHVFCENNGSNCAATAADVVAAVGRLNADFLPWRIQFVYEVDFINKTMFRYLDISTNAEAWHMKRRYSDSPTTKLNVYVVDTGGGSWGTFPWTTLALDKQGGIVMDDNWFVASTPLPSIFTHEVGHCLGLWHTHHGVTEVTQCSDCYEAVGRTAAEGDVTGDKCSDTNPTTNHSACADPAGTDPCNNNPWTATPYLNYMSYSNYCPDSFTPQQAGRMHCWTAAVLSGWLQAPVGPPAAPSGLLATAASSSGIDLSWTDNANNENGFEIQRGGAGNWAIIASVGANVTSFSDTGLAASTDYDYQVRATNTSGNSLFSDTATATTGPPAQAGDATASQDMPVSGAVSGSYVDTHASDNGYESITERESGGKPSKRYSFLEHKWAITVLPGASFTFHVEAFQTVSSDGDNFVFEWSSDDQNYLPMVTVTKTVDDDQQELPPFALPGGLSGTVYIRVRDTDRTQGNRALDTISIDHMFIRSQ